MYSLYKLFELKFSGKTSEEKYAASLGTTAKQFFLNICDYFKICQKHTDSTSHIEHTVNVLGEGPTKITITNIYILNVATLDETIIPSCLHFSMQNIEQSRGLGRASRWSNVNVNQ